MAGVDRRIEPFQRAVAAAMRALSECRDLTVGFGGERGARAQVFLSKILTH